MKKIKISDDSKSLSTLHSRYFCDKEQCKECYVLQVTLAGYTLKT